MPEAQVDDLREVLEAAYKGETPEVEEVETPEVETPEVEATPEAKARDEKGRFAAKAAEEAPEVAEPEKEPEISDPNAEPAVKATTAPAPPNGWTAEAKAKWHELPEEVQQAALKREEDIHKQASKSDDERNFGREMQKAVQPYLAVIQAEGGTPAGAVQSLMNTAYVLRTGNPEQKRQLLLQVAHQYGVDLGQPNGQAPNGQDPQYQALMNRINQLEGTFTSRQQEESQRLQTEIQTELASFAADPAHSHFEEVKVPMAALLREGAAKDLQDAYEQATWARPDIRATLLAQTRAEEEQKRKAEAKRQAEAAKHKAVSITGGPGETVSAPESRGLREELEAQFSAAAGGV